jgi:hypothetical protein
MRDGYQQVRKTTKVEWQKNLNLKGRYLWQIAVEF